MEVLQTLLVEDHHSYQHLKKALNAIFKDNKKGKMEKVALQNMARKLYHSLLGILTLSYKRHIEQGYSSATRRKSMLQLLLSLDTFHVSAPTRITCEATTLKLELAIISRKPKHDVRFGLILSVCAWCPWHPSHPTRGHWCAYMWACDVRWGIWMSGRSTTFDATIGSLPRCNVTCTSAICCCMWAIHLNDQKSIKIIAHIRLVHWIELNPGPKYSCVICHKALKWMQNCVLCDTFNEWSHTDCIMITPRSPSQSHPVMNQEFTSLLLYDIILLLSACRIFQHWERKNPKEHLCQKMCTSQQRWRCETENHGRLRHRLSRLHSSATLPVGISPVLALAH